MKLIPMFTDNRLFTRYVGLEIHQVYSDQTVLGNS